MKTRTNIHAGADQLNLPNPLSVCQQQKEYWMNQYNYMQNVLANCSTHPPAPVPVPVPVPGPVNGGGYVGGVWYADRSGICG
jgi:hypothetical protein